MVGNGRYLSRGMSDCLSFSGLHALLRRLRCFPRGAVVSVLAVLASSASRDAVPASAAEPKRKWRRDSREEPFGRCTQFLALDVVTILSPRHSGSQEVTAVSAHVPR